MTRETLIFETRDEAIAEAIRGAPSGDIIEIHQDGRKGRERPYPPYTVIGCTCSPLVMRATGETA